MSRRVVYVRCAGCKREVRGHVAKGGDGTEWHPYLHKVSGTNIRCIGSFLDAEITREVFPPAKEPR